MHANAYYPHHFFHLYFLLLSVLLSCGGDYSPKWNSIMTWSNERTKKREIYSFRWSSLVSQHVIYYGFSDQKVIWACRICSEYGITIRIQMFCKLGIFDFPHSIICRHTFVHCEGGEPREKKKKRTERTDADIFTVYSRCSYITVKLNCSGGTKDQAYLFISSLHWNMNAKVHVNRLKLLLLF